MTPHIEDVLLHALAQSGDRYVFGAEADPDDPNPQAFDCSELVEWSCSRAGVYMPDGAYNQWRHASSKGVSITVAEGIATRGALLYAGPGRGIGRAFIDHVAFSLGDGTTIEARGAKWGVGSWPSTGRAWRWATRIPDVDYSPRVPIPPPAPPQPVAIGDSMRFYLTELGNIYAVFYAQVSPHGITDPSQQWRLVAKYVEGPDWAWLMQPTAELHHDRSESQIRELVQVT